MRSHQLNLDSKWVCTHLYNGTLITFTKAGSNLMALVRIHKTTIWFALFNSNKMLKNQFNIKFGLTLVVKSILIQLKEFLLKQLEKVLAKTLGL